jgi:2-oxo-4-hydroxy-4-carboxy--5-ureidoimidazoline (OHCU) decarboxylase
VAFNHTTYKHERGLRSRPRNAQQMDKLFMDLRGAIQLAQDNRALHRGHDYPRRAGALQTARARIEALMPAVRQEQARNGRDPARRRRYGAELTYLSKRARDEKRLLMRMLGEWK